MRVMALACCVYGPQAAAGDVCTDESTADVISAPAVRRQTAPSCLIFICSFTGHPHHHLLLAFLRLSLFLIVSVNVSF